MSNLGDRDPDGHRGTREVLEFLKYSWHQFPESSGHGRSLGLYAGLSTRKECMFSVSVLPKARGHYTLQELRVFKKTWWFFSFGTSVNLKFKSYLQKLGRWLRHKALPV